MYTCRECERAINQGTEICPYCGADLTAAPPGTEVEGGKRNLTGVLIRLGLIGVALWVFLWFSLPRESGETAARSEVVAIAALREIHAELRSHAESQGGVYPDSLESLGERIRAPAQSALRQGYSVIYAPGPAAEDGRARSFTLEARPGNYGYSSFFADESGVLRATPENRPATAQDPPIR